MPPADLEHVEEADEVGVDVGARVLDGVPDAGLRGEVHDDVGPDAVEELLHRRLVGEVTPHELEPPAGEAVRVGVLRFPARRLGEHPQPVFLDADVVVVVHVVEADHTRIGRLEQPLAEEGADEANCAGYEYSIHRSSFKRGCLLSFSLSTILERSNSASPCNGGQSMPISGSSHMRPPSSPGR